MRKLLAQLLGELARAHALKRGQSTLGPLANLWDARPQGADQGDRR
jgi:hypothetical protein